MAPRLELEPLADRHVERLAELLFKDRDDLRRVNPSRHEGPLTLELAREGFTEIGLAQAYLFLDGAWQDQLLFQKLAP